MGLGQKSNDITGSGDFCWIKKQMKFDMYLMIVRDQLLQAIVLMEISDLIENRPQFLLGKARDAQQDYGQKFQKFNDQVYQAFQKIAYIRFRGNCYQKQRLPLAVLAGIIFMKNYKFMNDDFSGMKFLDEFRSKTKDFITQINLDKIFDYIKQKITSTKKVRQLLTQRSQTQIFQFMNLIAQQKGKGQVDNYNEEQMKKISSFFSEKVYLINYDKSKDALNDITPTHNNIYVIRAKEMYFIGFKQKGIELIEKGVMSHEQLAGIFNIENSKIQKIPKPEAKSEVKSTSQIKGYSIQIKTNQTQNQITSSQASNSPKKGSSQLSQLTQHSQLSISRIKQSALFPDQVSCTYCLKKVSQFSAIFWNYSYYCFECVLNPKKDISFIPSSIIQKFLKTQKMESKQFLLICSQCKSDTIISNYRPWDKPKNYRCKACQKEICVEHDKMIGQCFCQCHKCDKRTITIPGIYVKYCLSCKIRFCQICNKKTIKECECICKNCGQNIKIDHEECQPNCHYCNAKNIPLIDCNCKRKLCSTCYFRNMQPNSSFCTDIK